MWQKVIPNENITTGSIKCIRVGEKRILLTRSEGGLFACGAICPHQGISMENGFVFDDEITCPEHSWVFSLKTGELTWPGNGPRIPIYPVRITEESIEIDIEV